MHAKSQISLALRPHEERTAFITTTISTVEPISALSEADRALFKQASDEHHVVTTAETVFYPQGGGQPADTGIMTSTVSGDSASFEVSGVRNGSSGRILHVGRFVPSHVPLL